MFIIFIIVYIVIKDHDVYVLQDEAQTNFLIGYERVSSQLEFDSSYAVIR